ncbi:MAG: hypothetical protein ACEQR8_07190 [Cypionkella sp.]
MEAIERRSQDICANMLNVNDVGQLTAGKVGDASATQWWALWTHVLEELALRGQTMWDATMMRPTQFPWISHPEAPRGLRILGKHKIEPAAMVRLGQREHIKDALNFGRFRIAPAASYADPSLNPAIQDDELSVTAVRSGETAVIQVVDPTTGIPGAPLPVVGEIQFSRSLSENFFVVCMAAGYEPRLLDDFGYNAMLVIHNVKRFLTRIERAGRKIRPELTFGADQVTYYDPYRVRPDDMPPFFSKNFRYAYQREYRLVWYAPNLPLNCEPFFVEIGPMQHIARMHALRD